ncbi:MAG TPA: hypothetical protein QF870_02550, partial [Nitrospinota bacterium]|nr:hypothetical protein [Nitrospinota bacterium]
YTPSWFDTMNGQILSEVFPGFWDRFNNPIGQETIRTVLYWYLRSNAHGSGAGVDGGLILTQAALERLTYYLGHRGKSAAERVRKALTVMQINTGIRRNCQKLRALARKNGWQDGPYALTEIRNDLIHPKQKYGNTLSGSYYEGWNLGQWYVELMLMHLFSHNGRYGNRITQTWEGEVVSVPWA